MILKNEKEDFKELTKHKTNGQNYDCKYAVLQVFLGDLIYILF